MNRPDDRPVPDAGSVALEFTLVAPALLLLVALLLAYARVTQVSATLDSGVRDAARAATTARNPLAAQERARVVVRDAVGAGNCADSLVVEPIPEFAAGRAVTVTATCTYSVGDLGLPGLPGSLSVTSSFASPLDPNRELS
ncbi:TadE/TadG family type IV pilus assembly protein [Kineococcus radiotolerans]|uniref:TadE family protein n=1 Tax=Kineococcus radiotolerans (strain ATCC BAA-149 / DSM 14245 / SRS30216) TaxID=266940 RepID=A6WCQ4_KINRD|nr:TadE/TadG family type IV pilus assembly protein [Kineococcus radiotolerans]ABS04593.1 TadE family protein [Kineococcus radiotolerans SRS30216 = ATCC BAA-149]